MTNPDTIKGPIINIRLHSESVYQLVGGLDVLIEQWDYTEEYLNSGNIREDCFVRECDNAHEARVLSGSYKYIQMELRTQHGAQRFAQPQPHRHSILFDEYRSVVAKCRRVTDACPSEFEPDELLESLLQNELEWTSHATPILINLARQYGAFILRNALALAIALEIEDGSLGL